MSDAEKQPCWVCGKPGTVSTERSCINGAGEILDEEAWSVYACHEHLDATVMLGAGHIVETGQSENHYGARTTGRASTEELRSMTYAAEILADSISPAGHRLTTFKITFPRFVLAEMNTHRTMSRNSASSRAIPVEKRIEQIRDNPFVPEAFAANKRGMQAGEVMDEDSQIRSRNAWLAAGNNALEWAAKLAEIGVHKQWANRLIEPFAWNTAIVTATEWDNFWALRISEHAQPEIRIVAEMMKECYDKSEPQKLVRGQWHLPLVGEKYGDPSTAAQEPILMRMNGTYIKLSVARCARVSYLTHEGKRDPEADLKLYDRLVSSGHMSPLEHAARPMTAAELSMGEFCGNFRGWVQHRKEVPGEAVFTSG